MVNVARILLNSETATMVPYGLEVDGHSKQSKLYILEKLFLA